jgi:hypothetical protein
MMPPMRAWICLLALAACGLGDDSADGTRAQCAEGGALNDTCPANVRTPEQACFRMVDCGAIPLHRNGQYDFDWNRCVREIWNTGDVQARLMIACIGAATCDQLKTNRDVCFAFGEN